MWSDQHTETEKEVKIQNKETKKQNKQEVISVTIMPIYNLTYQLM